MEATLIWPLAGTHAFSFLLVLARVGALVGTAPIISGRSVPLPVKAGFTALVSLALLAANWDRLAPVPDEWSGFVSLIVQQVLIGALLGFAASLAFAALQMAGQLVGLQMGFALGSVIDPTSEHQVALLDQFYAVLAGLAFLALDGHHWLVLALMQTFALLPLDAPARLLPSAEGLAALTAQVPAIALRFAFPAIAALIVADVALGVLVKVAPQLNVFVVGLPLKIAVALLAMTLMVPWLGGTVHSSLDDFLLTSQGLWR